MTYQEFIAKNKEYFLKQGMNIHSVPSIQKVIVAVGIGSLHTRKGVKDFSDIQKTVASITGQKTVIKYSRKNISNFKLRSGMPSMIMVTLRGEKAYDFLFKTMAVVLPRVRDFVGLSGKSFDKSGNYSFGLSSYALFPEVHPDNAQSAMGMQVSIIANNQKSTMTRQMMENLGFVFTK